MEHFVSRLTIFVSALYLSFLSTPVLGQLALDREPAGPSSRKTGLAITEIMYNPRPVPGLDTNLTLEFIELFNSKPWDEDISGFAIAGQVRYVFPSQHVLGAGSYLVLARVPELIQTHLRITNVVGPWEGADHQPPFHRARHRAAAQPPGRSAAGGQLRRLASLAGGGGWHGPFAGAGAAVLWGRRPARLGAERQRGRIARRTRTPLTPDPLAAVCINEWQNHSDPVDWVELYNHGNTAGGCLRRLAERRSRPPTSSASPTARPSPPADS